MMMQRTESFAMALSYLINWLIKLITDYVPLSLLIKIKINEIKGYAYIWGRLVQDMP